MILKIGEMFFYPDDQPIMVILSEDDKKNIAAHGPIGGMKYMACPEGMSKAEIKSFMSIKKLKKKN